MRSPVAAVGYGWGRALARYSLWVVRPAPLRSEGWDGRPAGPAIFASWHSTNLIALALHRTAHRAGVRWAFVPPGLVGATMRGWLAGIGDLEAVELPREGSGPALAAMKRLAGALARGHDVIVAVDGPRGPAGRARPGALWLARLTGCPIVPSGFAARPALRVPRWDRHVMPLPGARVAAVYGAPLRVERGAPVEGPLGAALGAALDAATRRAWELVAAPLAEKATADAPSRRDR